MAKLRMLTHGPRGGMNMGHGHTHADGQPCTGHVRVLVFSSSSSSCFFNFFCFFIAILVSCFFFFIFFFFIDPTFVPFKILFIVTIYFTCMRCLPQEMFSDWLIAGGGGGKIVEVIPLYICFGKPVSCVLY